MFNIKTLLEGKDSFERAEIKAIEIVKLSSVLKVRVENFSIEILSFKQVPGGVEMFVRAWDKNDKQIGFGDGSVEIERFVFINPPVLIDDVNGDIVRESIDFDGNTTIRKLSYNPRITILESLSHTIKTLPKRKTKLVLGKVGNTTLIVYPDAGTGNTTVDGWAGEFTATTDWDALRNDVGDLANDTENPGTLNQISATTTTNRWKRIIRGIVTFVTSSIGSDGIDSATLWLHSNDGDTKDDYSQSINIYSAAPANDNAIVAGDYNSLGDTPFSSDITLTAWNTSEAYQEFILNAAGEAVINKSGISRFGTRLIGDANNIEPTWGSNQYSTAHAYRADEAGTAKDPKLVVEHSEVVAVHTRGPSGGVAFSNPFIY